MLLIAAIRHPMHLHGHDFRVLNGREYAPLKMFIDGMPVRTDTIGAANQSGNWFSIAPYIISYDSRHGQSI